ncbi:hypothetical protein [Ferviditalea candida]|uniref:Sulfotransferase domain-containing protein n=1 Tax=Ferviditalea candida TaxID=3108399 RepID=A0ABU5ZEL0_9BACL|nr:hypothetical protein [Paenibacillaceae bacterium T2]
MKKLILHIGMHKTGTTSLQKVFSSSQHLLNQSNIYYADLDKFNIPNSFYVSFIDNPTDHISFKNMEIYDFNHAKAEQERLKILWAKEFDNINSGYYIISDEELSYLPLENVSKMRNYLKKYFDDITVIMYAREPKSFIPSIINEHIKYGDSEIYLNRITYYIDRVEKYIEVFGRNNIIIRPFNESAFKNGNLFDDFFESLNINFNTNVLDTTIETNQSLGQTALTVLMEYNKRFPRFINNEINKVRGLASYRINIFFDILQSLTDTKFNIDLEFTEEETNTINREINYINQFLNVNDKFSNIKHSRNFMYTKTNNPNEVPMSFFLDLMNEYNKKIDSLIDENNELINLLKKT